MQSSVSNLESSLGFDAKQGEGEDGIDQYVQALFPTLLQIAFKPEDVEVGNFPYNSPIWKWAGMEKPTQDYALPSAEAIDLATTAIANLLAGMANQSRRQEMLQYFLAHLLRQDYGLGAGRGHEATTFSGFEEMRDHNWAGSEAGDLPSWEPVDPVASSEYEAAEWRMMWQACHDAAPPAQREAMQLYHEADETGRPLAELRRERSKDPNLACNNFQALKKAVVNKLRQS